MSESKVADKIVEEVANLPAKRPTMALTSEVQQRQIALMNTNDPFLHLLDDDRWTAINRGAKIIAGGACGKHLRGANPEEGFANALAVSLFASNIGWMPNLLAPEAYEVKGKITYSAKVIHALVKNHPDLVGSLNRLIKWRDPKTGELDDNRTENKYLEMRVIGQLKGDDEPRYVDVRWVDGKKAGQTTHWDTDGITQLWYMGIKIWARTWLPDASMGVYTREEIEGPDYVSPHAQTEEFITELADNSYEDVDPFGEYDKPEDSELMSETVDGEEEES